MLPWNGDARRAGLHRLHSRGRWTFPSALGHTVAHHIHGELGQVTGLVGQHGAAALGTCQRQQLIHCVGSPDAGAADLPQVTA